MDEAVVDNIGDKHHDGHGGHIRGKVGCEPIGGRQEPHGSCSFEDLPLHPQINTETDGSDLVQQQQQVIVGVEFKSFSRVELPYEVEGKHHVLSETGAQNLIPGRQA